MQGEKRGQNKPSPGKLMFRDWVKEEELARETERELAEWQKRARRVWCP